MAKATVRAVWHKRHREQGLILHSSIDTAAGWSKSGWRSWWYGWKVPLAMTVGAVWIPRGGEMIVTRRALYPDGNEGVEGRNVFHKPRSQALKPFNGSYKNVFA
jgi:hypothetical protein